MTNSGLLLLVLLMLPTPAFADGVDLVTVLKDERLMRLHAGDRIIREYPISLGDNPFGHKRHEGDERTPEGRYVLDFRNPESNYFLSIHISYPNEFDEKNARRAGRSPGGNIFIHGLPNQRFAGARWYEGRDWTDGCIAVNDNQAMLEIWELVEDGTVIEIYP